MHDALDGAMTLALAALEAHEAEYHRRAAELGAIVESSSDVIIGKMLDGIITSWNPAAERLYGSTAAEAVGQSVSLLIPGVSARGTLDPRRHERPAGGIAP